MQLFYSPQEYWQNDQSVEIHGQEAKHITKVLRHNIGDTIFVADGNGAQFKGEIVEARKEFVRLNLTQGERIQPAKIRKVLALGTIKKRDRLEFAIEKAVELDASEICLFDADHSERSRLNEDRLQTLIISAFKQSNRAFMPSLTILGSLDEVYKNYKGYTFLMAHERTPTTEQPKALQADNNVLLVGPEGGFSQREIELQTNCEQGAFVSLGSHRLRAETAVAAFLSHYTFSAED